MKTTFGECTDNEKQETMISDCSKMRTEGTSRPSVGLVGTARDNHLPASIPGVMIVAIHQVLEQIIILQSSLYSVSVHTYCVDGQLPSIKQITQATGDLQAI